MMEVWNSHGKWEVPKPYLIGGSADPMLVCIGDAQILTYIVRLNFRFVSMDAPQNPEGREYPIAWDFAHILRNETDLIIYHHEGGFSLTP